MCVKKININLIIKEINYKNNITRTKIVTNKPNTNIVHNTNDAMFIEVFILVLFAFGASYTVTISFPK